jgi:hypothetical protein
MQRTEDARTVFRITIPGRVSQSSVPEDDNDDRLPSGPLPELDRAGTNAIRHSDT